MTATKSLGYVYLIISPEQRAGKIGWSRDLPAVRLLRAQTDNPAPLLLETSFVGTRRLEGVIHESLKQYHIRGEWFSEPEFLQMFFMMLHDACMDDDDVEQPLTAEIIAKTFSEAKEEWLHG